MTRRWAIALLMVLLTAALSPGPVGGAGAPPAASPAGGAPTRSSRAPSRRVILKGDGPRVFGLNAGVSIPNAVVRMGRWLSRVALGDRDEVTEAKGLRLEAPERAAGESESEEENEMSLAWPGMRQDLTELWAFTRETGAELGKKFVQALYAVTGARIAGLVTLFQWLAYLLLGYAPPQREHAPPALLEAPIAAAAKRRPKPAGIPSWEEAARLQEWIENPETRIADMHRKLSNVGICKRPPRGAEAGAGAAEPGGGRAGGVRDGGGKAHTESAKRDQGPRTQSQHAPPSQGSDSGSSVRVSERSARRRRERRLANKVLQEAARAAEGQDARRSGSSEDFWGVSSLDSPRTPPQKALGGGAEVSGVSPKLRELEDELTAWRKSSERLGEKTRGTRETLSEMGGKLLEAIEYAGHSMGPDGHQPYPRAGAPQRKRSESGSSAPEGERGAHISPPVARRTNVPDTASTNVPDIASPQHTRFDTPRQTPQKPPPLATPVRETREARALELVRSKVLEGAEALASSREAAWPVGGGILRRADGVGVGIQAFSPPPRTPSSVVLARGADESTDVAGLSGSPHRTLLEVRPRAGGGGGGEPPRSESLQGPPRAQAGGGGLNTEATSPGGAPGAGGRFLKGSPRAVVKIEGPVAADGSSPAKGNGWSPLRPVPLAEDGTAESSACKKGSASASPPNAKGASSQKEHMIAVRKEAAQRSRLSARRHAEALAAKRASQEDSRGESTGHVPPHPGGNLVQNPETPPHNSRWLKDRAAEGGLWGVGEGGHIPDFSV